MLATILLKHFPVSPVPANDFIMMMRLVQAESGASSEAVCEVVDAAVKVASQAEATKEAWNALLEHVKPEVLSVPAAQPGIFSRLWSSVFGRVPAASPASACAEVATPGSSSPDVVPDAAASPAAAASPVACPAAGSSSPVACPAASPVAYPASEPTNDLKQTRPHEAPSVPEEKPVVPEPEKAESLPELLPKVLVQEPSVVVGKCEVPKVLPNQDASPKAAGTQKKNKNPGHK